MKIISQFIAWLCLTINAIFCKKKKKIILVSKASKIQRINSFHYGKLKLLLGLEGTLIHTSTRQLAGFQSMVIQFASGIKQTYYIKYRPYLHEFLEQITKIYDVSIYTTQVQEFADPIIKTFPVVLMNNYYRKSCVETKNHQFQKEVNFTTQNPHNVILVDADEASCKANPSNSHNIPLFQGDENDCELLNLLAYLKEIDLEMKSRKEQDPGVTIQDILCDDFEYIED